MIRSHLSLKLFAVVAPFILVFAIAIYGLSVPLIKKTVFDLEEHAGRSVLDTVFELASRIHLNLESYRELAIESHKSRIKNIVEITASYVATLERDIASGKLTRDQARQQLFANLRTFRYRNNDYIWVSNYDGVLVSHPDDQVQNNADLQELNENGELVLPVMVDIARRNGDGFHQYLWRRLGQDKPIPKISYFKDFPKWGVVIGTGVYLDDVEVDVQRRKKLAIDDLRRALRDIRVGRTGYLYIFDSNYQMVIHPNANIEGTDFAELIDPISDKPIGAELIRVADSKYGRHYKWDRPEDPGHYVYDKISWVRHFPGFDWYIASSVYVSELQEGSRVMGNRILIISLSLLILSGVLSFMFIRRITDPIKQLALTATKVQQGDLSARSHIHREDEIGILSAAFDDMVGRLKHNIDNLDGTVQERTQELKQSNTMLTASVMALESVQRDLAKSEARQRVILNEIPALVAQIDAQYRIEFVNRRYAELFRADIDALLGQSLPDLAGWTKNSAVMRILADRSNAQHDPFTTTWMVSDEQTLMLKTMLIPAVAESSGEAGFFVLTLDVTDEEKSRKRLMEMQRMNAVAQLAAGLAHDFNNLLSIILGNLSSASEHVDEYPGMRDYIDPSIRATRRGAEIMSRLLAFSRSQPLAPVALDVGALMRSAAQLMQRSLPEHIQLVVESEPGRDWVFADPGQLENAIVNLVLNARDAMPQGGVIRIASSEVSSEQLASFPHNNRGYIQIQVADEGQGFTANALEHAFEPFYTTKKSGEGSGLGLSMVFGFAAQSGGHVSIESQYGEGARINLILPRALQGTQESSAASHSEHNDRLRQWSGQLVVLVEDEPEVRKTVRRQLQNLGFSVLVCANGDEALKLIPNVEDLYLVLSDIVMPGQQDGLQLAQQLRRKWPHIALLLMTGYVDEAVIQDINVDFKPTILRKPFDVEQLRAAIVNCIDSTYATERNKPNDQ